MSSQQGGIPIILILVAVICAYALVSLSKVSPIPANSPSTQLAEPSTNPTQALQLISLVPPSTAPRGDCTHDSGTTAVNSGDPFDANCNCPEELIRCEGHSCKEVISQPPGSSWTCEVIDNLMNWCNWEALTGDGNGVYCVGKPVVYLYPTQVSSVDVSVEPADRIVVSDPKYPPGGWKNVIAYPSGKLIYQNKEYRELFYETAQSQLNPPKSGIIIPADQLAEQLTDIITKLGLTLPEERQEFLDWWLPRLKALNSPYILFSTLEPEEKSRIDQLSISPKPDTMIEFIAYFKPLSEPMPVLPLSLPQKPPERVGFTAVEWGGVIDSDKR